MITIREKNIDMNIVIIKNFNDVIESISHQLPLSSNEGEFENLREQLEYQVEALRAFLKGIDYNTD